LEFDIPYRELTPTVHCLINVIEYPFFVMSLDDVQIAYFERVQFSLRAFDLVFSTIGHKKKFTLIPFLLKVWRPSKTGSTRVISKYYQGSTNLNWRGLLDLAAADPKKFWSEGGWSVLDNTTESGDEQEAQAQAQSEGPDDYRPSASEESDYEMDGSSVEEDGGNEVHDDFANNPVKEPDEGLDWDQLEAHAGKQDLKFAAKRGKGYDSDQDRADRAKRQRRK